MKNNTLGDFQICISVPLSDIFQYNMITTINKPTRVTRNTATAIDHIITNTVISGIQHRSGIIKTDISDHFPIVFALITCEKSKPEDKAQFIYKRIYEEEQIKLSKHELNIQILDNPNTAYESFLLFKILRLQKPLQSPLRRNKSFMDGFLKRVLRRMNSSTKLTKIFSKQSKRKQRKYITLTNYLNVLEILNKP